MKRLILCAILGVLGMAPSMFADVVDYLLNVNGTLYCDQGSGVSAACAGSGGPSTNSGLTAAGATGTLDTSLGGTGLGTVNLTFDPGAAGSYNVGLWLFENLIPVSSYDEYGATGGALGAGQSWQIDTPDYYYSAFDPNTSATGTIIANTEANTLSNTNDVPGGQDSITGCSSPAANCNDYTSLSLAQNFSLTADQEEVLTFTMSTTAPTSGFYLSQSDPGEVTGSAVTYYYSETANTVCSANCGVSGVPEPSSWIPLLAFAGLLVFAVRRRASAV
jgi:MYXO-CTERM domain-containing protein